MTDTALLAGDPAYAYTYAQDVLRVENLSVSYERPILRDVDLTIRNIVRPGLSQGQVDGLLAPSGMGKTQLFRCIAGLQKPSQGQVLLGEGVVDQGPVEVRAGQVGVVAQDYPLFNHLKVLDNIVMAARVKQPDAKLAREMSLAYLDRFGLADAANKYPHEISGGMRQRAAIIQQVVSSGHVLLMDEPFSGLDPIRKEEVQQLILTISSAHELNSIVLTTHDVTAAIIVCDTITLLGRERDAQGAIIPGARVRFTYDLKELGLSWRPNIRDLPQFRELQRELMARFHEL